jgi:hypothetical protein
MNFSLDKDKAMELAEKLGLKVSFNNEKSGVIVNDNDNKMNYSFGFDDFFPELETLDFITKDKDVFSRQITFKHQITKVEVKTTQTPLSQSNTKQLMRSA